MSLARHLRAIPAFAALSASNFEPLEHAFNTASRPPGYELIKEGEQGDAVHLILEGELKVSCAAPSVGQSFAVSKTMGPGELVGLLALVDQKPRSATCRAIGELEVATLPLSAAQILFTTHAPISYAFQRVVAEQLARDARQLFSLLAEGLTGTMDPEEVHAKLADATGIS